MRKCHGSVGDAVATDGPFVTTWKRILEQCPYDELDPRQYCYRFICRLALNHGLAVDRASEIVSAEAMALYIKTLDYHNYACASLLNAIKLLHHASPADALRNHARDNRKYKYRKVRKRGN